MPLRPLAFLSYAHIDDEYHGGAITEFRKQLSLAVRVVAGLDFDIFQDRGSIEWGQSWRETLDAALGEVRFLIPILTPSFFRSDECRKELQVFLDREAAAGRNDLVLPIHYVTCSVLEDAEKRRKDQQASALAERQYRDWRPLRHEPFTSPKVRQALEELGLEVDQAMRRTIALPRRTPTPKPRATYRKPRVPSRGRKPSMRSRSAEPDDLSVIRDGDFAPELVLLPQGEFMMGSTDAERRWAMDQGALPEWIEDEMPQHRVAIGYRVAVGRYPVTFEEWDQCADDAVWHRSKHMQPYRPPDANWGRGRSPVINVSWEDAQAYLRWLSSKTGHRYRLLSEAEWEYACRAETTTPYNVGLMLTNYDANFCKKVGKTVEVNSYTPNEWGLYDMHGNVWEWVEDCWNESYESPSRPDDGSTWTSGDCTRRVLRGGSWKNEMWDLRSANRFGIRANERVNDIGFRVARTLNPCHKTDATTTGRL